MKFCKAGSPDKLPQIFAKKLIVKLGSGQKVFWIVTGGSAIKIEAEVSRLLKDQSLGNLSVTLSDERYAEPGHKDSNWQQLVDAGFELPGANLLPVLTGQGRSKTTEEFADNLENGLNQSDYSIGIFGIGPDGHTAGILPGSPCIDSPDMAVSYADDEATPSVIEGIYRGKDRVTMTAVAIARLDEIIVVAFGKKPILFDKLEQATDIETMPAQALKQVDKLTIYNDSKGEQI